jgi:hypothetical protein
MGAWYQLRSQRKKPESFWLMLLRFVVGHRPAGVLSRSDNWGMA